MGGKGTFGPGMSRKATRMTELDGVWKVERESGALPPLPGVTKRIHGARGETRFPGLPPMRFEVRRLSLHYHAPFDGFVDVLEPAGDGYRGRALFRGRELGTFRLTREQK